MPRNITITFNDGSAHRYENIPDSVTPDMIEARASKDFPGKRITNIDGGKGQPAPAASSSGLQRKDIVDKMTGEVKGVMYNVRGDKNSLLKIQPDSVWFMVQGVINYPGAGYRIKIGDGPVKSGTLGRGDSYQSGELIYFNPKELINFKGQVKLEVPMYSRSGSYPEVFTFNL